KNRDLVNRTYAQIAVVRSALRRPKTLIDTTFLLSALGIEVVEDALKAIELFRRLDVYYLD
ncbi:MAG: hypothetical protein QW808_01160, partial [Desulfurococcaceae archaeon]